MKKILIIIAVISPIALCAPLFNSFNSGELSPLLKYRVDLQRRQMGVETMTNMIVKPQGAVFRRPGTEYIADVNNSTEAVRMFPFEYSDTDSYVLVFNDGIIRFFRTVP